MTMNIVEIHGNSLQKIYYELDNFYFTANHLIATFRRDHINL